MTFFQKLENSPTLSTNTRTGGPRKALVIQLCDSSSTDSIRTLRLKNWWPSSMQGKKSNILESDVERAHNYFIRTIIMRDGLNSDHELFSWYALLCSFHWKHKVNHSFNKNLSICYVHVTMPRHNDMTSWIFFSSPAKHILIYW